MSCQPGEMSAIFLFDENATPSYKRLILNCFFEREFRER